QFRNRRRAGPVGFRDFSLRRRRNRRPLGKPSMMPRVQISRRRSDDHYSTTILAVTFMATARPAAQPVAVKETTFNVERALQRLPYYGVFDFLAFGVDRGTVTLQGYAYQGNLKSAATRAVKRVSGVDEVANSITLLPASQNDDRIRWATFYRIYTDDFLSRYAPGGPVGARYEARQFARFPGMQPYGTYPIH